MSRDEPITTKVGTESGHRHERALTETISGLEIIRAEGPEEEPVYPSDGDAEAREDWAYDSASYERAQIAHDALEQAATIMEQRVSPSASV